MSSANIHRLSNSSLMLTLRDVLPPIIRVSVSLLADLEEPDMRYRYRSILDGMAATLACVTALAMARHRANVGNPFRSS